MSGANDLRQVAHLNFVAVAKGDRPFHDVPQFANIARPIEILQNLQGLGSNAENGLLGAGHKFGQELIRQHGDGAPAFAQASAKKLVYAHIVPAPESAAVALARMAEEVTKRSNGALDMQFHGGTLLSKELEIMNAVKAGNISAGGPAGAAATVFPEMGVFLVPYLVKSYDQA